MKHDLELTGFTDGSLVKCKGGKVLSGIGGVIKQENGSKLVEFLGPSNAEKVIEVEMADVITLLGLLEQADMKVSGVLVLTDCKELIGLVQDNLDVRDLLRVFKIK